MKSASIMVEVERMGTPLNPLGMTGEKKEDQLACFHFANITLRIDMKLKHDRRW